MVRTLEDEESCQLLGPISIVIQLFMGIAAITILLLKRNHEHPRRKFIVWLYDVGKQVIGAVGIHFVNLGVSVLKRKGKEAMREAEDDDSQCDWYFLNLLLDTTIGVPILWGVFTLLENILLYLKVKNIESGNYFSNVEEDETANGDTNALANTENTENTENTVKRPKYSAFLKQLAVFTTALALMKMCTYFILDEFENVSYWLANIILGWSDAFPNLQIFLVMFVFPVLLNCFQYFCVDNIIKLPTDSVNYSNVDNFETDSFNTSDYSEITASSWNASVARSKSLQHDPEYAVGN